MRRSIASARRTVKAAADKYLLDPATGTFGPRWQTNAAAVISGAAGPEQYDAIWKNVLSQVGNGRAGDGACRSSRRITATMCCARWRR